MKYYLFSTLLFCFSFQGISQNLKGWQIDVHSGIQTGLVIDMTNRPLEDFNQDLSGFEEKFGAYDIYFQRLAVGIGVNYQFLPYLKACLNINQYGIISGNLSSISGNPSEGISYLNESIEPKFQSINLNAKIDALYKSPYEELNLILGLTGNIFYLRTVSNILNEDDPNRKYIESSSRTMRQIRFIGLNIGLEWRDYFSEHFGYFLQLSYMPTVHTRTANLHFEQINIKGDNSHPLNGKSIQPGTNGYPSEPQTFDLLRFKLGLTYQW